MGITSSIRDENDLLDLSDYMVVERQTDCLILRQYDTNAVFKYREFYFSEREGYERIMKEVKKHRKNQFFHILKVISMQKNIVSNVCSSSFHIGLIMEHSLTTLEDEIKARNAKNIPFSQNQVYQLLNQFISASPELIQVGIQSLIPHCTYLMEDGILKFNGLHIDPDYGQAYFSPQRFQGTLYSNQSGHNGFSCEKQLMFSTGLMMISIALLQNCLDCYDFKEGAMRLSLLEDKLNKVTLRYSNKMSQVLQLMVKVEPNNRVSFDQLAKKVRDLQGNNETRKPFSESPINLNQQIMTNHKNYMPQSRRKAIQTKLRPKGRLSSQFKMSPVQNDKTQHISSTTATDYLEELSVIGSVNHQDSIDMVQKSKQLHMAYDLSTENQITHGILSNRVLKLKHASHRKTDSNSPISSTPNKTKGTHSPQYSMLPLKKNLNNEDKSSTAGTRHKEWKVFESSSQFCLETSCKQKGRNMGESTKKNGLQLKRLNGNNIN